MVKGLLSCLTADDKCVKFRGKTNSMHIQYFECKYLARSAYVREKIQYILLFQFSPIYFHFSPLFTNFSIHF